jgi:hypothetical protein
MSQPGKFEKELSATTKLETCKNGGLSNDVQNKSRALFPSSLPPLSFDAAGVFSTVTFACWLLESSTAVGGPAAVEKDEGGDDENSNLPNITLGAVGWVAQGFNRWDRTSRPKRTLACRWLLLVVQRRSRFAIIVMWKFVRSEARRSSKRENLKIETCQFYLTESRRWVSHVITP